MLKKPVVAPEAHYHGILVRTLEELLGSPLPSGLPLVFARDAPLPLAIGISKAIVAQYELTAAQAKLLRRALGSWCKSTRYQRALAKPGAQRHGIDGEPVEPVAPEQRDRAQVMLRERDARKAERKQVAKAAEQAAVQLEELEREMVEGDPLRARARLLAAQGNSPAFAVLRASRRNTAEMGTGLAARPVHVLRDLARILARCRIRLRCCVISGEKREC